MSQNHCIHAGDISRADRTEFLRQPRSSTQADSDSFTVQVSTVAGHLLDSVAKRMTKVEQCPTAFLGKFTFVRLDNCRLQFTATPHDRG